MNVELHGQLNTAPREVVDRRFVAKMKSYRSDPLTWQNSLFAHKFNEPPLDNIVSS